MKQSVFAAFLFCAFLIPSVSHAQWSNSAGVEVTPATIERRVAPGESFTEQLTFVNLGEEEREFYLYKRNIKGVEGEGSPIFADEGTVPTGFELTEWLSVKEEPIVIAGNGGIFTYDLVVTVPQDATPGSHFGGVFISAEPPRLREIGAGVGFQVASILSFRVDGEVIDDVRVRSFSTDKLFYGSKKVKFIAKIENQGNILVRPHGPMSIESMLGGESKVVSVNEVRHGVFPRTVRDFEFEWDEEGVGFGRYQGVLALSYDGDGGQRTIDASVVFWVFPTKVMVPLLITLIVLIGGFYIFTRLYIRRVMMDAGTGRRVPQRLRRQVGVSRFAFVFVAIMGVIVVFLIVLLIFFA